MSDLCYNCGSCHLGENPKPCPNALTECIICKNLGHQYIFCPKSAKIVNKKHTFLAICHNCDKWHLPEACQEDFVQCPRCYNFGHLPHFCPVSPLARGVDLANGIFAVNISQIHHELLRKIKTDVCADTIRLLEDHSKEQVLQFMSRIILPPIRAAFPPPNGPAPPIGFFPTPAQVHQFSGHAHDFQDDMKSSPPPMVVYDHPFAPKTHQQQEKPDDPLTSPTVPPTPGTFGGQQAVRKVSNDHDAQDGAQPGGPAETQASPDGAMEGVDGQAPAKKAKVSKPKAKKAKVDKPKNDQAKAPRRAPQPRCADCKKKHKRCDHGAEARGIDNVAGSSQSPQPMQTPEGYTPAAEVLERQTATPDWTDGQPSTVSRLQLQAQPEMNAADAQNGQNAGDSITQHQQEALRSATASLPPMMHAPQAQNLPDFQGNWNQVNWLMKSTQRAMFGQPDAASTADGQNTAMQPFNTGAEQGVMGFRPAMASNGQVFAAADQEVQAQPDFPSHMMEEDIYGNKRVVAPNHHHSDASVFAFDENGQVVDSIEEHGAAVQQAEENPKGAGRKRKTID